VTEQANMLIFANAYKLLRRRVADGAQLTDEDRYFHELERLNNSQQLAALVSFNSPPRIPKGGWTHKDLDTFLNEIDRGLKLEDIKTTIKLKETFDIKPNLEKQLIIHP
jgi:hypothetical protein